MSAILMGPEWLGCNETPIVLGVCVLLNVFFSGIHPRLPTCDTQTGGSFGFSFRKKSAARF